MSTFRIGTSSAALIEDGGTVTTEELQKIFRSDGPLIFFLGTHFITNVIQGRLTLEQIQPEHWLPIVRTRSE